MSNPQASMSSGSERAECVSAITSVNASLPELEVETANSVKLYSELVIVKKKSGREENEVKREAGFFFLCCLLACLLN